MPSSAYEWKHCGECGTFMKKNKFGQLDCPKCNIENFLFPYKNKVDQKEEGVKMPVLSQDQEKVLVVN